MKDGMLTNLKVVLPKYLGCLLLVLAPISWISPESGTFLQEAYGDETTQSANMPPALLQTYREMVSHLQNEDKSSFDNLSYHPAAYSILLRRNLKLVSWQRLPRSCYLVKTQDADLYFVETISGKLWLYKVVVSK